MGLYFWQICLGKKYCCEDDVTFIFVIWVKVLSIQPFYSFCIYPSFSSLFPTGCLKTVFNWFSQSVVVRCYFFSAFVVFWRTICYQAPKVLHQFYRCLLLKGRQKGFTAKYWFSALHTFLPWIPLWDILWELWFEICFPSIGCFCAEEPEFLVWSQREEGLLFLKELIRDIASQNDLSPVPPSSSPLLLFWFIEIWKGS